MSQVPLTVFLDANVLYKARLRDLLTAFQANQLANVHWSEAVEDEWLRNSVRNSKNQLNTKTILQNIVVPQLHLSITGWKAPDANPEDFALFAGVDPKDLHVASSAHRLSLVVEPTQSVLLVTLNTKDFPLTSFKNSTVTPISPGQLLDDLHEKHKSKMLEIAELCRNLTSTNAPSVEAYSETLKSLGCKNLSTDYKLWKTTGPL